MSLPVDERIARVIKERIEGVTVANGYNVDVVEVVRPLKDDDGTIDDYKVILRQLDKSVDLVLSGNPVANQYKLQYGIILALNPSDTDDTPIDALTNVFEADVIKAITTPYATWHNFADDDGSTAVNAEFDPEQPTRRIETQEGVQVGTELFLNVYYRTPENDPYTVRL